ncbi:hypothetical protein [Arthrobacter sp. SLBN-53]|nr:hypothetical protein [Arthrobacter sp. SLBN-53]TQK28168.1 hypothetical protein FBY28_1140 [Arthrobacter sp. SLBN-53]
MASHHTKDKGDLGVAKAFSDLVAKGYTAAFRDLQDPPGNTCVSA